MKVGRTRHWVDGIMLAVLLVLGSRWLRPDAQALLGDDPESARAAPDLRFVTTEGKTLRLRDAHGKVVMLTYWASWCSTCRHELRDIQAVHAARGAQGLVTIGVSVDRGAEPALAFAQSIGLTFPIVIGGSAERQPFDVVSIPTTVLVGRKGRVRHVFRGSLTQASLRIAVDRLLAESDPDAGGAEENSSGG